MITLIQSPTPLPSFSLIDGKWHINFNQRLITLPTQSHNPEASEETSETEPTQVYSIYHVERTGIRPTIRERIDYVLEAINDYDASPEVNTFLLSDGNRAWLNKATRLGLLNSLQVEKANGKETTTLWLNNRPYEIAIDSLLQFLNALELYAIECFNTTQRHIAQILSFDPDAYFDYDFTVGYPEPLTLTL